MFSRVQQRPKQTVNWSFFFIFIDMKLHMHSYSCKNSKLSLALSSISTGSTPRKGFIMKPGFSSHWNGGVIAIPPVSAWRKVCGISYCSTSYCCQCISVTCNGGSGLLSQWVVAFVCYMKVNSQSQPQFQTTHLSEQIKNGRREGLANWPILHVWWVCSYVMPFLIKMHLVIDSLLLLCFNNDIPSLSSIVALITLSHSNMFRPQLSCL